MSSAHDPRSLVPPRLPGRRDPGDAWVTGPDGTKYWGRFGAAGLVAIDRDRGMLMQHRAAWSHHGGTWGIPGGALHAGEEPVAGALREAHEEAAVPLDSLRVRFTSVADKGVWQYTTVVADVSTPFEPAITDAESIALEWVALDELRMHDGRERRALHPALESTVVDLLDLHARSPHLVIDAANVVGARPDGWWKDRKGAAEQLVGRLEHLARIGVPAAALGLPGTTWFPAITVVCEGRARGTTGRPPVEVLDAPADGDALIAGAASALVSAGESVTVVTSDRELRARCERAGAQVHGATWLHDLLAPGTDGT